MVVMGSMFGLDYNLGHIFSFPLVSKDKSAPITYGRLINDMVVVSKTKSSTELNLSASSMRTYFGYKRDSKISIV